MITSDESNISDELIAATLRAIRLAQQEIRWKPDKDIEHLQKRILMSQLPSNTNLDQYIRIIHLLLHDTDALIYLYFHSSVPYPVIISDWNSQQWAVIIGMDGVMESAFMLVKPEQYIERRGLLLVGRFAEVNNE